MNSLPILFTKMSGAGNTFAMVSTIGTAWSDFEAQIKMPRSEFAKLICDKTLGLAVDGFLLLSPGDPGIDYAWDFYNSDGSRAEMCGNATRCAARYCYEVLDQKRQTHFKFLTGAGIVEAIILGEGQIRVKMPPVRWLQKKIELVIPQSNTESFAFVNTGVPHLVQKLHSLALVGELKEMARQVRHHHDIQPHGSNVTFYAVESSDKIRAVTYERGVEDYTLACGTGAVAAAFVHQAETQVGRMQVAMPGGNMMVSFPDHAEQAYMEGDAVFVGDFKYSLEVFL